MNNLPTEILKETFKLLHQLDKVECMKVYSSWKKIIEKAILFKTIRLTSKYQLRHLATRVQSMAKKIESVDQMIIETYDMGSLEFDTLSLLVSNINEITIYHEVYSKKDYSRIAAPDSWKKSIRMIKQKHSSHFTEHILEDGICPLLSEIQLYNWGVIKPRNLLNLLGNTPNLKKLELGNTIITPVDLEILHTRVTLLNYLSLNTTRINLDVIPTNVKPARLMKSLELISIHTTTTEDYIDFQKYLAKKYKYITDLNFDVPFSNQHDQEACLNRGTSLFLQQVGPSLETLEFLNTAHLGSILIMLDRSGCKIRKFVTFTTLEGVEFQSIIQSHQAEYIQTLSLFNALPSDIAGGLTELTALTELQLYHTFDKPTISLELLLRSIGNSLNKLELSGISMSVESTSIPVCRSISSLKLEKCNVMHGTDFYISQAFPKLQYIFFNNCNWNTSTFFMGKASLINLEIRTRMPSNRSHILITKLYNNESRWYISKKATKLNPGTSSDPVISPSVKSFPFEALNRVPYLHVIVYSLNTFFMMQTS